MKKLSLLVIAIFSVSMMQAQTPFAKYDQVVNAGLGLGTYGVRGNITVPPLSVSYDYGIEDNLFNEKSLLSVGGYVGYYANKTIFINPRSGEYGSKFSNFLLGARGAVHYNFVEKLDTYGGLMLGYNIASVSYYGNYGDLSVSVGGFISSVFLGARYYFADNIAGFVELGYGLSALEIGVAFKL